MIVGSKVILRDKKLSDARDDYRWQTTPDLVRLDATPLLTASYPTYLLDYISELRSPTSERRIFAVETTDGKHIGNCVYYHIDEAKSEAELGILIGDRDYWDDGYGADAVTALVSHIFLETNLKRVYLKTLDWNQRAQKCFQKCGFLPCGYMVKDGHDFILMELYRKHWEGSKRGVKPA